MKDRMIKIINALNTNVINLDNFDKTYVNDLESNPHQIVDEELININGNDFDVSNDTS